MEVVFEPSPVWAETTPPVKVCTSTVPPYWGESGLKQGGKQQWGTNSHLPTPIKAFFTPTFEVFLINPSQFKGWRELTVVEKDHISKNWKQTMCCENNFLGILDSGWGREAGKWSLDKKFKKLKGKRLQPLKLTKPKKLSHPEAQKMLAVWQPALLSSEGWTQENPPFLRGALRLLHLPHKTLPQTPELELP